MNQIILAVFIACIDRFSEANHLRHLGTQSRFNSSTSYDSYYICNIFGGTWIQWLINGEDVGTHSISNGSLPGSATFVRLPSLNVICTSMILSVNQEENGVRVHTILVINHNNSEWTGTVICSANTGAAIATESTEATLMEDDYEENSVTARHVLNENDLVFRGYATQVLICQTRHQRIISWLSRERTISFNHDDEPGAVSYERHPYNTEVALYKAILLERTDEKLTTMIIWTDNTSVNKFNLYCRAEIDKVRVPINVNPHSLSTQKDPRTGSHDVSQETPSPTSPPSVAAGCRALSPDLILNELSVGLTIMIAAGSTIYF